MFRFYRLGYQFRLSCCELIEHYHVSLSCGLSMNIKVWCHPWFSCFGDLWVTLMQMSVAYLEVSITPTLEID